MNSVAANSLGPSHHVFYGALHRRRLWLGFLSDAAKNPVPIPRRFVSSFPNSFLGIRQRLQLEKVLNDTPIDSFLVQLAQELIDFESAFFSSSCKLGQFRDEFENVSLLFGREVAQEALSLGQFSWSKNSLNGIFEAVLNLQKGGATMGSGQFSSSPLLLRRSTPTSLQYEIRDCPHSHIKGAAGDLGCWLEGLVTQAFVQALVPQAEFKRITVKDYCLDDVRLA